MIRAAALAAVLVVLGGCDIQVGAQASYESEPAADTQAARLEVRNADRYDLQVLRDPERGVTCWRPYNDSRALSCLPDWMLDRPQPASAECGSVCQGFKLRRDALACADGRLPKHSPECVAWRKDSMEARQ